jgi:hypothetical protein
MKNAAVPAAFFANIELAHRLNVINFTKTAKRYGLIFVADTV